MQFLLRLPVLVSVIIISAVSVGISVIGLKLVRRRFSHEALKENHEVAGFIYNAFMLIYAVLVAFVVFVSWTDYSDSKKNVEMEANLIVDVFSDSRGLPDTMRAQVRTAVSEYVRLVINEEWKEMEYGRFSPAAREQLGKLWNIYFTADGSLLPNQAAYAESLSRLNDLGEYRRMRIFSSRDQIPGLIWVVLVICASCSVVYTFFFGVKNIKAQYVMTSVLALINALILYLIFVLDHPFKGAAKVTSSTFMAVERLLQQML